MAINIENIASAMPARGSVYGADGLYYRCEEKPKVPLSAAALQLMFYLIAALRHVLYSAHELVYVSGDQFIYYVPHDPTKSVAPDVYARFGVPKEPERQVFRTWEEGGAPGFVAELSSDESRQDDRSGKMRLYQDVLRCQELSVWFGREPGVLVRVYDPVGRPLPTFAEMAGLAARAEESAAEIVATARRPKEWPAGRRRGALWIRTRRPLLPGPAPSAYRAVRRARHDPG